MNYQNFTRRYFEPALEKAGLRRITLRVYAHVLQESASGTAMRLDSIFASQAQAKTLK